RLFHSIPIAPPRFRPTEFLPQCSPIPPTLFFSTLTLGETAERILFVSRLSSLPKCFSHLFRAKQTPAAVNYRRRSLLLNL
ncbi:MAG TPA: hypothetical protein VF899_08200, partial [Pyrinomonadaceae bacterium]